VDRPKTKPVFDYSSLYIILALGITGIMGTVYILPTVSTWAANPLDALC
jgi:hypothetical protein